MRKQRFGPAIGFIIGMSALIAAYVGGGLLYEPARIRIRSARVSPLTAWMSVV